MILDVMEKGYTEMVLSCQELVDAEEQHTPQDAGGGEVG